MVTKLCLYKTVDMIVYLTSYKQTLINLMDMWTKWWLEIEKLRKIEIINKKFYFKTINKNMFSNVFANIQIINQNDF